MNYVAFRKNVVIYSIRQMQKYFHLEKHILHPCYPNNWDSLYNIIAYRIVFLLL